MEDEGASPQQSFAMAIASVKSEVTDDDMVLYEAFDEDQITRFLNGIGQEVECEAEEMTDGCKVEGEVKSEGTASHQVLYKVQDGRHIKIWQCNTCLKEFSHQYTLMRHLPTHTDERKYSCPICGKAFRQMSTLSQHRAIHSADRPYVCEICEKTFNRVSTLISHRKTHTGSKPHRCYMCDKAFHQKGNLRNHIFTHTNERPYKCDVCGKGFNQMSNLMCHKVKAHQRCDKPRYTCRVCGKEFQKRIGLRNHEQCQHGVGNSDTELTVTEAPRIRYTNGVVVEPIETEAMHHALSTGQTPFALLRPLNGIPVLVRVLPAGAKQMLVPATADDLKKHGRISIRAKTDGILEDNGNQAPAADDDGEDTSSSIGGSTVQIRIPVVATVVQRKGKDGNVCMTVQSPGEAGEDDAKCIFTTTTASQDGAEGDENQTLKMEVDREEGGVDEEQYFQQHLTVDTNEEAVHMSCNTLELNDDNLYKMLKENKGAAEEVEADGGRF